jgi:hypothetical protein
VDVHGFSEVSEHLLGTSTASHSLVIVARLAADQFLVFIGHGAAADPFAAFMNVNMIEFGHGAGSTSSGELRGLSGH